MTVFQHHIYEYKKGLRNLVLHTMPASARERVEAKLDRCGIAYLIHPLGRTKMNVFFGASECVDVVRSIGKPLLSTYSPEEDFILGTMLGYDRLQQCRRYLTKAAEKQRAEELDTAMFPDGFHQLPGASEVIENVGPRGRGRSSDNAAPTCENVSP